ncbi:MAG: hypothetical protein JXQ73_22670 [Phycisphaerae bacterium]|nr:hypothetical protein [Phycisphaerae bacterium]
MLDRVGAIGDSLTDESWEIEGWTLPWGATLEPPYENWVEQLIYAGRVSFGPLIGWGYDYNCAEYGATTYDMPHQADHVIQKQPTLVFMGAGGNDLIYHFIDHALMLFGPADGQDPIVIVPGMVSDSQEAIETIWGTVGSPNGRQMIIATAPEIMGTPAATTLSALILEGSDVLYRNACLQYNTALKAIAAERAIPVIDMVPFLDDLLGPPGSRNDAFLIGGVEIDLRQPPPQGDPNFAFLSDGYHPGTVVHGLLANLFIEALNQGFGADVPLLSDQEILAAADIPNPLPPGTETFYDVSAYIIVPEPFSAALLAVATILLCRHRRSSPR